MVAPGGGMHGCSSGGVCGCSGGMHGFIWGAYVVLFGGHAWFYSGACVALLGGMHGFIQGGMHGFIWGGMQGFFSFFGYNEIRSMSGRYTSYWNAFLFLLFLFPCSLRCFRVKPIQF